MEQNISPAPWRIDPEIGEAVLDRDGYMVADCAIFSMREDWDDRQGSNAANVRAVVLLPLLVEYVKSSALNGCATAQALIQKLSDTRP